MTTRITRSTDADLRRVLNWLEEEYEENGGRGFWCNANLITEGHHDGTLYVLHDNDEPLGFHLEGAILEIRPDRRRNGYGRALVDHWIERAQQADVPYLSIQCSPKSSIPFWRTIGFQILPDNRGYRILPKTFTLPEGAEPVAVEIGWYPEEAAYGQCVEPLAIHRPRAARAGNRIQLAERIAHIQFSRSDLIVKIQVDGETLYCDKVKYPEARALGIQRYGKAQFPAYFCDWLVLSGDRPVII